MSAADRSDFELANDQRWRRCLPPACDNGHFCSGLTRTKIMVVKIRSARLAARGTVPTWLVHCANSAESTDVLQENPEGPELGSD
jgi:hypothetical protein